MLVVNFAVDVSEIAPILLGSFLAFRASDFKAFGDGVSGGSAQVVREPGGLLPDQGYGGLIWKNQREVGGNLGSKRLRTPQRVGNRAIRERQRRVFTTDLEDPGKLRGDAGGSRKHTPKVPKTSVNGGPVAVEGMRSQDVGVDQLLRFEAKEGPHAMARMPFAALVACSLGRICTMDS